MNAYMQIKSEYEGVYYKVKTLASDYAEPNEMNADFRYTLNGTLSMTFGGSHDVWSGTIKISPNDDSDCVTVAKLKEWTESSVYTKRQLWLIDHDGNGPIAVFMTLAVAPKFLDPLKKNQQIPFELRRRA